MKILHLNSLYWPDMEGGAEWSVKITAEMQARNGHEVTVVCAHRGKSVERTLVNRVNVIRIPLANIFWPFETRKRTKLQKFVWHLFDADNPVMAFTLRKLLHQLKPDLIHTHNLACLPTAVWRTAKKMRIPVVHTLRDYYMLCPARSMRRGHANCGRQCLRCRVFGLFRARHSRYVDLVIGVSRYILQQHIQVGLFPRAHRLVLSNPCRIDVVDFHKTPPDGQIRFGYIGRLWEQKGVHVLLEAFYGLRNGSTLLIAGTGTPSYEERLQGTADDSVHFAGYMEAHDFFGEIDVLVVPSLWHEPFARVIVEAFHHGIPVIASRRGGITESVEDGVNGLLFDPDDSSDLRAKLSQVCSNPERLSSMSAEARKSAVLYEPQLLHQRLMQIYGELLSSFPE